MLLPESKTQAQRQRIQVEIEPVSTDAQPCDKRVKIRVENYDEILGWYPSGSLALALHQLPLLEQAINEMRAGNSAGEPFTDKIIPFPDLAAGVNN